MNAFLEKFLSQQLLTENSIIYAELGHEDALTLYIIQLTLASVFLALWLLTLHYSDTQL